MATYKITSGDYTITPNGGSGTVTIDGNLTVNGTSTEVTSTNLAVTDNEIIVNDGESGAGVTAGTAGLTVDRGSETNARIVFDESDDSWKVDTGTGSLSIITTGSATGLTAVVDDTTPQLGGNLDVNGSNITSVTNNNVVIAPDGTGTLRVDAEVELEIQASDPGGNTGYQHIYGKAVGNGGSGIFFQNPDGTVDELVSKTKAMVFGLIF